MHDEMTAVMRDGGCPRICRISLITAYNLVKIVLVFVKITTFLTWIYNLFSCKFLTLFSKSKKKRKKEIWM